MPFARISAVDVGPTEQTLLSVELSALEQSDYRPVPAPVAKPAPEPSHPVVRRATARTTVPHRIRSTMPQKSVKIDQPDAEASVARDIEPVTTFAVHEPPAVSAVADTKLAESRRKAARAEILKLLLQDLARRFNYPTLALRRGWQGEVLLSITVYPDGQIDRIHVSRTSGYDVLDRAAVDTLQRVGRLGKSGRWPDARALELLLPVEYRLTD